jgi:hypothetical protein
MKSTLQNGILIRIMHSNKTIEDRLIPQNYICMTRQVINNKEVIIPIITLSDTYTSIMPFDYFPIK